MEMPGNVVGIYNRSPSFNGGMNSLPSREAGDMETTKTARAMSRVVILRFNTRRMNGR